MFNQQTLIQLIRYALTGFVITAVHLGIYEFFHMYLSYSSLKSSLLADIFSVPLSYLGHFHVTFKDQTTELKTGSLSLQTKFAITAAFSIGLNSFWAWLYVDSLGWHRFYYMASTICVTPIMSFLIMKFLVFKKSH